MFTRSENLHFKMSPGGMDFYLSSSLETKGPGFEPHRLHCGVSLSKNINPSLVLVQPRKTRPFITERLLMGH